MKSVPVEKWQNKFLNYGSANGLGDLSMMISTVSDIREAAKEEERKRIAEEVSAMFSVYPDGGIHDFGPDEELVSKRSVLSIINKHQ